MELENKLISEYEEKIRVMTVEHAEKVKSLESEFNTIIVIFTYFLIFRVN